MSHYPGMELIELTIEGWGTPKVVDYVNEERRVNLLHPNEVVISEEQMSILFRYPLSNPVTFTYAQKGGFTRMDVFRLIYEGYKQIYEEEEQEGGNPGTYKMLYNRRTSSGKYGIWGHYMEDLWIEFAYYDTANHTIHLIIGS